MHELLGGVDGLADCCRIQSGYAALLFAVFGLFAHARRQVVAGSTQKLANHVGGALELLRGSGFV